MAMEIGGEELAAGPLGDEEGVDQSLNISDVCAAIQAADPSFQQADGMYPVQQPASQPYVRIVEQPASKALRFRYECEGRSAGSIPGVNSTPENKSYPTIEICGYQGRAVVVVSCVTKDEPHRPHPHNLVGKEQCKKGVCTVEVTDNKVVSFANLGIQCVKKRDIEGALRLREEMRVDPFKTGFSHRNQPSSIDLNAVRLCFQVFLEHQGKFRIPLPAVVSDVIHDKKATSDLTITRVSHVSAPVAGGQEVILLCEKVSKEDIMVNFYEICDGKETWNANADILLVHKQYAIYFRTPAYRDRTVVTHLQVHLRLIRPSTGERSDPVSFELIPLIAEPEEVKRKRHKKLPDYSYLGLGLSEQDKANYLGDLKMTTPEQNTIKLEPREKTPPIMGGSNMGIYHGLIGSPSPVPAAPHAHYAQQHHYVDQQQYNVPWNIPIPEGQYGLGVGINLGGQVSPGPSQLSPVGNHMSPAPNHMSPVPNHLSPGTSHMSPGPNHMSPGASHLSPGPSHMSPGPSHMSPGPNISPGPSNVSPVPGTVSPGAQQYMSNFQEQPHNVWQDNAQNVPQGECNVSASELLLVGEGLPPLVLNSSDLSSLSRYLPGGSAGAGAAPPATHDPDYMTDSFTKLTTADYPN